MVVVEPVLVVEPVGDCFFLGFSSVLCFPETLNLLLVLEVFGCWVGGGFFWEVLLGLWG